jgi:hypothetical protein
VGAITVLGEPFPDPWLCLGDFNEVVAMSEKWGGGTKSNSQISNFQSTLEDYKLSNLCFKGPKYMWTNCREGQEFIKERLDRGVANPSWKNFFSEAEILVEVLTTSDHATLMLCLTRQRIARRQGRQFWYEAFWA